MAETTRTQGAGSPAPAGLARTMVDALGATWAAIRERHPDVPEVVLTIGSGSLGARAGTLRLGHFAAGRWQVGEGAPAPELFVGGEGMKAGPVDVLGTLLHEAAHGLAHTRRIKDTSRQGKYHNGRYRALAEELGLVVVRTGAIGWSGTSVPAQTADLYAHQVDELAAALSAWRLSEPRGRGRADSGNGIAARCPCGRRIRITASVLEAGPIVCGMCEGEFAPADAA